MITEQRKDDLKRAVAYRVSKVISKQNIFGDALQDVWEGATEEEREFLDDLGYAVDVH